MSGDKLKPSIAESAPPPPKDPPPPTTEPLPADEARKFIKEEIGEDLKRRAIWFFSIFGIANVLALGGIWVSVQSAAKDSANEEAKQTAHAAVDTLTKSIGDTVTNSLEKFVTGLTELEKRKANLESQIATGEKDLKSLNDNISAEQTRMKSLNENISADTKVLGSVNQDVLNISARFASLGEVADRLEKFRDIPETMLASVIGELNGEAKNLVPKLEQIFSELHNVYSYGITVVDSNIVAAKLRSAQVQVENIMMSVGTDSQEPVPERKLIDPSQSAAKFQLPKGSEVLATWGIPFGGTSSRGYAVTADQSDPTKIEVLFSKKGADEGDIRVYVLYRTPVHPEATK